MPSPLHFESSFRLLATGTEHYSWLEDADLEQVPTEIRRIVGAFSGLGYCAPPGVTALEETLDLDSVSLKKRFAHFRNGCLEGDLAVAYYSGHGARDGERFYILTQDSNPSELDETAIAAEDLARILVKNSKAAQVLMIIDTCYAGAGAAEFAGVASRLTAALGDDGPALFVIAAARVRGEADQGALSKALQFALGVPNERFGGHAQPYLQIGDVMGAVDNFLKEYYPAQVSSWSANAVRGQCRLFPNPSWRRIPSGLDLDTQRSWFEHSLPKTQSSEVDAGAQYFTGRSRVLRKIVQWICTKNPSQSICVVTGGPGCGKSAVLAQVVALSSSAYQRRVLVDERIDLTTIPPADSVDVAIHARNKLLVNVAEEIADALELDGCTPITLLKTLSDHAGQCVIVIDALDESDEIEAILGQLLIPLSKLPNVQILVGVRFHGLEPKTNECHFDELLSNALEINLDNDQWIEPTDIRRYVECRLLATEEPARSTKYRGHETLTHDIAKAVAERANNNFLVAHTTVLSLLQSPFLPDITVEGWMDALPSGLDEAFEHFLRELDITHRMNGPISDVVRVVLLSLSLAEGAGLPWSYLWRPIAEAVSKQRISDEDIARVREYAGAFIVEVLEENRSVYRLYHELLAEHLRGAIDDEVEVQARVVTALVDSVHRKPGQSVPDWSRAHPYILSYLTAHAVRAQKIDEVVRDGAFLVTADPSRCMQALEKATSPFSLRVRAAYLNAINTLTAVPEDERLPNLIISAYRTGNSQLAKQWEKQLLPKQWEIIQFRQQRPVVPHHSWRAQSDGVLAMVLGQIGGRDLIFTANSTVRRWDTISTKAVGQPIRCHTRLVQSIALGRIGERDVIVTGEVGGVVQIWDAMRGTTVGASLLGHVYGVSAVALGRMGERDVVVAGAIDGTLCLWDATSGATLSEKLRVGEKAVIFVAIGCFFGRNVIVACSRGGNVWCWDFVSGEAIENPLKSNDISASAIALGQLGERDVFVIGAYDGTVRIWDAISGVALSKTLGEPSKGWLMSFAQIDSVAVGRLGEREVVVAGALTGTLRYWDANSGESLGILLSNSSEVESIAICRLGECDMLITGGADGKLRRWDFDSVKDDVQFQPPLSHGNAIALGRFGKRNLILIENSDEKFQLIDALNELPFGGPLQVRADQINCLEFGRIGPRYMLITGSIDGKVWRWDVESGAPIGKPLLGHASAVTSIVFGSLDGRDVIVAGGSHGFALCWDSENGKRLGEPLAGHSFSVVITLGRINEQDVIVTADAEGKIRCWSGTSGTIIGTELLGHCYVTAIKSGRLGKITVIVAGAEDGKIRVWDALSGVPLFEPQQVHEESIIFLSLDCLFGRDVIITGCVDGIVQIWDEYIKSRLVLHTHDSVVGVEILSDNTIAITLSGGSMEVRLPQWY